MRILGIKLRQLKFFHTPFNFIRGSKYDCVILIIIYFFNIKQSKMHPQIFKLFGCLIFILILNNLAVGCDIFFAARSLKP